MRGFVREIASLAGIILGIWLASVFHPQVTELLKRYLPSSGFLPLLSFAVLFTLVIIVCNLLGWLLKLALKKAFLGWLDRTLGAGLAIAKGIIFIYLVIVLVTFFVPPEKTPYLSRSKLAPLIVSSYQRATGLISPKHYQRLKRKFLEHKKEVEKKILNKTVTESKKNGQ